MLSPRTIREKYSGGPNLRAKLASVDARRISRKMVMVPAMNEPKAEIPSAGPALPLRAIWYPARQVITEAASPGMLTRMEVVEPPYIAPYMIPASKMTAETGGTWKVAGRSNERAAGGPTPGRTPTRVPTRTPKKQ